MRPERLVLVCGTGTEVGKTWVAARLLTELRSRGLPVAARKPAQSFDVDCRRRPPRRADRRRGAGGGVGRAPRRRSATRTAPTTGPWPRPWPPRRWACPPFTVADLVEELDWPAERVEVGVVETAGGVRSPQAADGDATTWWRPSAPDLVVLVADAGLGTINGVRLSMDALAAATSGLPSAATVVVLDRFDGRHDIHRRNRAG